MPDYVKLTTIKNLIDRANTDGCPTTRELYRQMAINEAKQINVTLTPEHFPAFTEKTPSVPEENAVINAGNEKIEVPNALPEYPGSCPVCGLVLKNNMAWISHKKAHTR